MSAFTQSFLFLDNPRGGVENLADMKAAGFQGVFCNVRDYPPSAWEQIVLPRARSLGMFCGPWGRTVVPNTHTFDPLVLERIINTADRWGQPLIVNSEKELDGTGAIYTSKIAQAVGTRDGAISMEPWLFPTVDWKPVANLPMLLQIFPVEAPSAKDPAGCKKHAHDLGCHCVYFTFGTYGGQKPGDFNLQAPYSLFTADAMGAVYPPWSPTSSGFPACKETDVPLTEKQLPYTGPMYGPSDPKGPTRNRSSVKGIKRGMIRTGFLKQKLGTETDDYGLELEKAVSNYQHSIGLARTGDYGRGVWTGLRYARVPPEFPHAGEYAMDALARKYVQEDALKRVYPHPKGAFSEICQGLHPTAGLIGNWAIDFCAPGGTKVLAVERATIRKLSGRDPSSGADNTIGIFGWSIHYETGDGYRYFSTHYGSRASLQVGQVVEIGQTVGTVGHWPGDPSRSHTHLGVTSPLGTADAKRRITAISQSPKVAA